MIRDVLIRGLEDEIRLDIFGESKQDMSLEFALWYVEAMENAIRSTSRLNENSSSTMAAVTSSYKRHEKNACRATRVKAEVPSRSYFGKPVDPDAPLFAHHIPIPIPVHWQDDVKTA